MESAVLEHSLDWDLLCSHGKGDLVRFRLFDARIVGPLADEQRRTNLVDVEERRDPLVERAVAVNVAYL